VPGQPRMGAFRSAKSRACCCSLLLQVLATGAEPRKGRAASCVQDFQPCRPAPMVSAAAHLCSAKPPNHDERPEMGPMLSGMSGNHRVALDGNGNGTAIADGCHRGFREGTADLKRPKSHQPTAKAATVGRRSDVVRASCARRSRTADCERQIRPSVGGRHLDGLPLSSKLIRLNRLSHGGWAG
jgi:hypothetical protein